MSWSSIARISAAIFFYKRKRGGGVSFRASQKQKGLFLTEKFSVVA
jgi:hypothetical protein